MRTQKARLDSGQQHVWGYGGVQDCWSCAAEYRNQHAFFHGRWSIFGRRMCCRRLRGRRRRRRCRVCHTNRKSATGHSLPLKKPGRRRNKRREIPKRDWGWYVLRLVMSMQRESERWRSHQLRRSRPRHLASRPRSTVWHHVWGKPLPLVHMPHDVRPVSLTKNSVQALTLTRKLSHGLLCRLRCVKRIFGTRFSALHRGI